MGALTRVNKSFIHINMRLFYQQMKVTWSPFNIIMKQSVQVWQVAGMWLWWKWEEFSRIILIFVLNMKGKYLLQQSHKHEIQCNPESDSKWLEAGQMIHFSCDVSCPAALLFAFCCFDARCLSLILRWCSKKPVWTITSIPMLVFGKSSSHSYLLNLHTT